MDWNTLKFISKKQLQLDLAEAEGAIEAMKTEQVLYFVSGLAMGLSLSAIVIVAVSCW